MVQDTLTIQALLLRLIAHLLEYQPIPGRADRFVPERFLDDAPAIPKGAWIPFGVGPRVCIGQHFAMLEMTLLAAMLLQRYRLRLPEGVAVCVPKLQVTLRPEEPVTLLLARRG